MPNLLEVQLQSYEDFLQAQVPVNKREKKGLHQIFMDIFPVTDIHENYSLEYLGYHLGPKRYSIEECRERNMTYAAPLKVTMRLVTRQGEGKQKEVKDIIEQDVYLGELPLITEWGTFIINGAERVIVSQLHRSPGVFFDEVIHPNGKKLYSARVIPYRGSWVEFGMDVNDILYVYLDSKKKIPLTTLFRCVGYSTDEELVNLFYEEHIKKVNLTGKGADGIEGSFLAETIVDRETGEILFPVGEELSETVIEKLLNNKCKSLKIITRDEKREAYVVLNTLKKDATKSREEALIKVYSMLRPGEPPTLEMAESFLDKMLFNNKRYDLGEVGRYMINQRMGLDIPLDKTIFDVRDFIAITRYLIGLRNDIGYTDDIDHLGNRRARTVGELLSNLFSVGLSRVARTIRERLSLKDQENLTPQ
ncbi:MAG: DNA-directed RNA polymerase subunit beta, partial [candidate division Zixibacteria bacterium]|nr:DNA-directed RNA polymerase subunit beta [candidate division Zixibacteria bacterium]